MNYILNEHEVSNKSDNKLSQIIIFFIGIILLFCGLIVYLIVRPFGNVWFLSPYSQWLFKVGLPLVGLGFLGGVLPSFFHTAAFSFLTISFLPSTQCTHLSMCSLWIIINILFEIGQKYHEAVLNIIPNFFNEIPILNQTYSYFLCGTFDYWDIVASVSGGIMAYWILEHFRGA